MNFCLCCKAINFNKYGICDFCYERINKSRIDNYLVRCAVCGYPVLSAVYKCPVCTNYPDYRIQSVFDYKDLFSRDLLFDYKFRFKKKMSKFFAHILKDYIDKEEIVIPVPSSDESIKKRGWDQMYEISSHLDNKKLLCLKNNATVQQKLLNKNDRIITAENKFIINAETVKKYKDSSFVVIDDVYTTGSTIRSAMDLIRASDVKDVRGLTLFVEM